MGVLRLIRRARRARGPAPETAAVTAPAVGVDVPAGLASGVATPEPPCEPGATPTGARIQGALRLHRGGKKQDAWSAFHALLADPQLGGSASVRPMIESEIYSRMRACLEREACFPAALTPAVLSYCYRGRFYALQGRRAELDTLRSAARFDQHFTPLLERARLLHALAALRTRVEPYLAALPALDAAALTAEIEAFRQDPPPAPTRLPSGTIIAATARGR